MKVSNGRPDRTRGSTPENGTFRETGKTINTYCHRQGGWTGGDFLATTATDFLVDSIDTRFDRKEEKQADYMGVIWALELGFSPYGAAALHESMTSDGAPVPFLSAHPSNKQRITDLRDLADRLDPAKQTSQEETTP